MGSAPALHRTELLLQGGAGELPAARQRHLNGLVRVSWSLGMVWDGLKSHPVPPLPWAATSQCPQVLPTSSMALVCRSVHG